MPMVNGKYEAPTWTNGAAPAISASELQAMSDAIAAAIYESGLIAAFTQHYITTGKKSGTTLGASATAEGYQTTASAAYTHAEGGGTIASAMCAHAEGSGAEASGLYSHAEGSGTTASESYSHAEGRSSEASGVAAHAEGQESTASGDYSHSEGSGTTAGGNYSHAEGSGTSASNDYAHAEGRRTTASGECSHSEGYNTSSGGDYAHAEGLGTIANYDSQHVSGRYNSSGDYAEIIGNGMSANSRANARTLDWSGNERLAGKLTVGAGPENSMDVTTKQYVDNLIDAIYTALAEKQDQLVSTTATLAAANWSDSAQTVSISGVTSTISAIVTPAPASAVAYGEAGVYCTAQGTGTLTFSCGATAPTVDLTVNILLIGT